MEGDENRDKRMSCTVNLLNFYKKEINRSEMYIRYIYKLCDLHIPADNYTEAAFTLKLHADTLCWSWNLLPTNSLFPTDHVSGEIVTMRHPREQPEWQLKEQLYLTIIDYFDKGKCWEEGIKLIKELADFYEKKLFDYAKWSAALKNQARFLDNILTQLRPEPEYFRVGFFGQGFASFLRNKVFIYRGLEYEKIGAFTTRLQMEFPAAQVLTRSSPPEASILNSDEQYIQIFSVKPVPALRKEFEGQNVPDKIVAYYLTNDVNTFTFDRPIHKGPQDKENEFKSLWIERSTLTIASKLPGILRWFEVVKKEVTEISPLAHACETVENMNRELERLVTSYNLEPSKPISPLSMRLQGVIEAAVNGGVAKYQDAFFNPRYISLHPEQATFIRRLKQLILQKVRILEGGLSLHGRLAPSTIQPLHRRLVERFTLMRQNVMEASNNVVDVGPSSYLGYGTLDCPSKRPSILNTPLPPIPKQQSDTQGSPPSAFCYESTYQLVNQDDHRSRQGSLQSHGSSAGDDIYAVPLEKVYRENGNRNGVIGLSLDLSSVTDSPRLPERRSPSMVSPPPPPARLRNSAVSPVTPPPRPPMPGNVVETPPVIVRNRTIPRSPPSNNLANSNIYTPEPSRQPLTDQSAEGAPPLPPRNGFATIERTVRSPTSESSRNVRKALSSSFAETTSVGNNIVKIEVNSPSTLTRRPVPVPPVEVIPRTTTPPDHPPPPAPQDIQVTTTDSKEDVASSISIIAVNSSHQTSETSTQKHDTESCDQSSSSHS